MFALLKSEGKVQSPSTILTARFQNVSADSVITDRYKHISVAIYVSSVLCELLYFNANCAYVTRLIIGGNETCNIFLNMKNLQSVNVDEKWEGASFGSILRRNKLQDATLSESILRIIFVLSKSNSSVKQVQYCSVILQVMKRLCLLLVNTQNSLFLRVFFIVRLFIVHYYNVAIITKSLTKIRYHSLSI